MLAFLTNCWLFSVLFFSGSRREGKAKEQMVHRKLQKGLFSVSLLQACNNHFCVWSLLAGEGESRREHRSMWVHLLCLNQTTLFKICHVLVHDINFAFPIAGKILWERHLNKIVSRKKTKKQKLNNDMLWRQPLMMITVTVKKYCWICLIVLYLYE